MIAEIKEIKKNILGTTSIVMKLKGMRKYQDFIFYPVSKDIEYFKIQSDTRIAKINLKGEGVISKPHQHGAYFFHLSLDKLTHFSFSPEDWESIKEAIRKTASKSAGKKENGIIQSDNSGVINLI